MKIMNAMRHLRSLALASAVVCGAVAVAPLVSHSAYAQEAQAVDIDKYTKTIEARGYKFPVVDYGKGPAVVMMHGFPDSRHLWRYQIKALGDAGFRVIAPDLRGMGDAPILQDPKDFGQRTVIQDVLAILDSLKIQKFQLIAHDHGAAVGWRFAAEHPDRVERYVTLSIGAPGSTPRIEQRRTSWYIALFRQAGVAEEQLKANDWALFREWEREKGVVEIERDIKNLSRPGALTSALNWYRATENATLPPAPPVTVPVLGIWSDGDVYLTETSLKTSGERVKGPYRYEKVYGASHWLQLDRPVEVNRLLLSFLAK